MGKDYYAVLGVAKTATEEEIKKVIHSTISNTEQKNHITRSFTHYLFRPTKSKRSNGILTEIQTTKNKQKKSLRN